MTFEIPSMMPLIVVFVVALALTAIVLVAGVADFLLSNRKVRVARHQTVRSYYGHLVTGH